MCFIETWHHNLVPDATTTVIGFHKVGELAFILLTTGGITLDKSL